MTNPTRVNAFADLAEAPPVFTPKAKAEKPVPMAAIEKIAEENNFPSRRAEKPVKEAPRKQRRYRTGRDQHVGIKATGETRQRFYAMADERGVVLGEVLKQGLDALEAVDRLQKIATKRGLALNDIVQQAIDVLERAGGAA
jgi:hypothetical protein